MSTKVEELRRWADWAEKPGAYGAFKPGQAREAILKAIEAALQEEFERGRAEGEASLVGEYECAEILSDGSAILKKRSK